jgi:ceramide glucosyltransferase
MIIALQLFLLLLIGASVFFYAWCALSTGRFFTATKQETRASYQPVSVLIPVCGVDEDALKNWDSFCQQDYEQYEVLFGVMNPQDPAVPILKELVARNPSRARLVFCVDVRGINHQISNLMHLLEAAQHEVVILTNSDIYVTPDYLGTVTAPLADREVGIVTCGYLGHDPKSLPAALASFGRCIDFIPSVLVASSLEGGLRFALGATIATRKSVLEKIGGLQSVVNRLGSDYHIGNMVVDAGYRVELSQYIVETDAGRESFQQLLQRELRWARTSRWNRGLLYYGYMYVYGTVYCIPLLLLSGADRWAVVVCLTTIAVRVIQALVCIYSMRCPKLVRWLWALPIRDLMSFVIWLAGTFGQTIHWRGRRLRIGAGGLLTE